MKCKGCGQDIDLVRVYQECWQEGTLKGKCVVEYGLIEEIETIAVECFECGENLADEVECG